MTSEIALTYVISWRQFLGVDRRAVQDVSIITAAGLKPDRMDGCFPELGGQLGKMHLGDGIANCTLGVQRVLPCQTTVLGEEQATPRPVHVDSVARRM